MKAAQFCHNPTRKKTLKKAKCGLIDEHWEKRIGTRKRLLITIKKDSWNFEDTYWGRRLGEFKNHRSYSKHQKQRPIISNQLDKFELMERGTSITKASGVIKKNLWRTMIIHTLIYSTQRERETVVRLDRKIVSRFLLSLSFWDAEKH